MIMLNNTRCPSDLLRKVLAYAAKSVGVMTKKVVVQVNQGRHYQSSGEAWECFMIFWGKRDKWGDRRGIPCRSAFRIVLPRRILECHRNSYDALQVAKDFLRVAQHEWAHIYDFHNSVRYRCPKRGGRRIPHDERPSEQAAERAVARAWQRKSKRRDDVILELAIWLEA